MRDAIPSIVKDATMLNCASQGRAVESAMLGLRGSSEEQSRGGYVSLSLANGQHRSSARFGTIMRNWHAEPESCRTTLCWTAAFLRDEVRRLRACPAPSAVVSGVELHSLSEETVI
eukprot:3039418-Amphidinium_carterae.1